MDKKTFLSSINYEEKSVLANVYEKIILGEKTNKTIFINEFFPPNLWSELVKISNKFYVNIYTNGIFDEAERRMICISPYEEFVNYPIEIIKVTNKSKFKDLQHKDFLGAIMSLGIVREKIGDLFLDDNICYAAVCTDVVDYLKYNLDKVGNCPCEIKVLEEYESDLPQRNFEEKVIISTSLRVDCVVSALCNLSRNKAVELVDKGKVLLNYNEEYKKDKIIKIGDVLTVRRFGKYKIVDLVGTTQKNRCKVKVQKYI